MAIGTILTSAAVPFITNLATGFLNKVFGGGNQKQSTPQPQQSTYTPMMPMPQFEQIPMLSQYDALQQAQSIVNPLFDQQLDNTMKNMDYQNMQRGFYGQLPGDVLKNARALDVERSRASQTSNLAQQLFQQSQANSLAQQQMQMNAWLNQQQLGQNWDLNQQQMANQQKQNTWNNWMNLGNSVIGGIGQYYNWTGQLPWQGNPLSTGSGLTAKQTLDQMNNLGLNTPASFSNIGNQAGYTYNKIY